MCILILELCRHKTQHTRPPETKATQTSRGAAAPVAGCAPNSLIRTTMQIQNSWAYFIPRCGCLTSAQCADNCRAPSLELLNSRSRGNPTKTGCARRPAGVFPRVSELFVPSWGVRLVVAARSVWRWSSARMARRIGLLLWCCWGVRSARGRAWHRRDGVSIVDNLKNSGWTVPR
jgi:hypothetical protein